MSATEIQAGDWVLIRAKVLEVYPGGTDLGVELFSKTDQYTTPVRRDLCDKTMRPIPREPGDETAVWVKGKRWVFQRLTDHWYRPGHPEAWIWPDVCALDDAEPEILAP